MWDHLTEREGGWFERLVESCAICREPSAASRLAAQKGFCIDLDQPLPGTDVSDIMLPDKMGAGYFEMSGPLCFTCFA